MPSSRGRPTTPQLVSLYGAKESSHVLGRRYRQIQHRSSAGRVTVGCWVLRRLPPAHRVAQRPVQCRVDAADGGRTQSGRRALCVETVEIVPAEPIEGNAPSNGTMWSRT